MTGRIVAVLLLSLQSTSHAKRMRFRTGEIKRTSGLQGEALDPLEVIRNSSQVQPAHRRAKLRLITALATFLFVPGAGAWMKHPGVPRQGIAAASVRANVRRQIQGAQLMQVAAARRELVTLALLFAAAQPSPATAVVGGSFVGEAEMRAQGLVGLTIVGEPSLKKRQSCATGTLIDAKRGLVLTARHNVEHNLTHVVLSPDIFGLSPMRRRIVDVRVPDDPKIDLAIVRFEGKVPSNYRPVTLLTRNNAEAPYSQGGVIAYGFGAQDEPVLEGRSVDASRAGKLKRMRARLSRTLDRRLIATRPMHPEDGQCYGDSGGPVFLPICRDPSAECLVQIGVLSFGVRVNLDEKWCAGGRKDYCNLAEYSDWIEGTVSEMGGMVRSAELDY